LQVVSLVSCKEIEWVSSSMLTGVAVACAQALGTSARTTTGLTGVTPNQVSKLTIIAVAGGANDGWGAGSPCDFRSR
jgi:hypothetical protein